ncbi:MAG: murein biosynthesis integral membrane protein MurJ, partial [Actinomycetota bacterium]|nr:murein biosynthesis integral membrane protein MurJ [Actinomycetota bacterium]
MTAERTAAPGVLGSARGMALGTVASRATGFLRTAALAAVLGVASVGTVYDLANTTPNIVYELLLGGILTSIVVPLLVRAAKDDPDGGEAYAQKLLTVVVLGLGTATVLLVAGAPLLVDLYAGGLSPDSRELAIVLARFFLPQVLFYGVGAVLGAVLNTRGRFAVPMWAPVLNNLVVIAACGVFLLLPGVSPLRPGTLTDAQVLVLGLGTTLGIVAQTVALVPSLRAAGFRLRLRRDLRGVGLGTLARLARWTLLYVAANQLAYLVVVNLATEDRALNDLGRGYAAYVKAFVLWQLPHAVVAVSVITALLPGLSRAAADGRTGDLRAQLDHGLRLTVAVLVPAAVAYVVLGRQVAVAVFGHGRTSVEQAAFIGVLLSVFALGLVPFSAYQLQLRAFYAAGDTRTPTLVNLGVNAVLVVADLALYALLPDDRKVAGLAAGHAISYAAGLALCTVVVRRRIGGGQGHVLRTAVRCLVASLPPALLVVALAAAVRAGLG